MEAAHGGDFRLGQPEIGKRMEAAQGGDFRLGQSEIGKRVEAAHGDDFRLGQPEICRKRPRIKRVERTKKCKEPTFSDYLNCFNFVSQDIFTIFNRLFSYLRGN